MSGTPANLEDENKEVVTEPVQTEQVEVNEVLSMSDDDFAKLAGPTDQPVEEVEKTETEDGDKEAEKVDGEDGVKEPAGDEETSTETETPEATAEAAPTSEKKEETKEPVDKTSEKTTEEPKPETKDLNKQEIAAPSAEQAQAFYMKVLTPFQANGKTIQLKTPEEAIQLMQMGANYTKKMQAIQPHRKVLTMLENNELLDETRLSFLIDLDKKNPEAIKKLIKDANIDPLDLDMNVEPTYSEGNHSVTDQEVRFKTELDELASTDVGKETIKVINTDWDQASKDVLWEQPDVMAVINSQRENGIYDQIAAEVSRRKTLGQIPVTTPFLEAYHKVGLELFKSEEAEPKETPSTSDNGSVVKPAKEAVATRAAAPKAKIDNEDKASAASPTRSTPKTAETKINPLAMSDDDFLKQMQNRL